MPKTTLGDLELLILLAVLRCDEAAYGVTITDAIRDRTGRKLARAAVYVTLQRLQKQGLVGSELGEPLPERGGKARRYYRVMEPGMELLRGTQRAYERMWDGLGLSADAR